MKSFLLALGALFTVSAQAQQFSFKDWAVACDNTRHCEITGYQQEESDPPVTMWLSRDAGGNAPVLMRMDAQSGDPTNGPFILRVGKVAIKGIQAQKDLSRDQITRLLPALKEADVADVADASHQWRLSLAGFKAALLKIDDLQGRVDTVTALSRAGAKPASAVPAPLPQPILRAAALPAARESDARQLPEILKTLHDADCELDAPSEQEGGRNEIHRLSDHELLVFRECGRGAYQSMFDIWRVSDKRPYQPVRVLLPDGVGAMGDMVIEPDFEHGVLISFGKGRGIADCGELTQWLWTADGFKLQESFVAPICKGMPGGGFMLRTYTSGLSN